MIALRRTFAILLAMFFIILFIPVLAVYRVNSTVANPGFYVDQLRRADVYHFLYDDVLPAAILQIKQGDGGNLSTDFSWAAPYLATTLEEALPQEWLQAQTEKTIYALVPYFNGSRDSFVVAIMLKDRVEAGATAIKNLLHDDKFTSRIYDEGTSYLVAIVTSETSQLPFPLDEATARSLIRRMMPASWLATQVDSAVSEATPYFTKDKEHFVVRIDIASRLDDIREVLVDVLSREESYDYLVGESLSVAFMDSIPVGLEIAPGVSITGEEIVLAVRQVLSLDWYQCQVSNLGDQTFAYLEGTQPNLDITINLADRKPVVATELAGLLDQKLEQAYNSLPEATASQAAGILASLPSDRLPDYRLSGISYTELKQLSSIDAESLLAPVLSAVIPDQLSLGEALASGGSENPLVKARDYLQNGFTYTDQQMAEKVGSQRTEGIRDAISSGFIFTDQDLRKAISGDRGKSLNVLDQARSIIKTVREVLMFFWILPLLLLVIIGLLGGRTWGSKLVWTAVALTAASLVAVVITDPVFTALVSPQIDRMLAQISGAPGSFGALFADRGVIMLRNAVGGFIGGIRLQATILLVVSAGLIVLGSILHRRRVVSF